MSAITFFATTDLGRIVDFYVETVGADVWLEQPDCTILKYDNQLLGFCERDEADTEGILTFVYADRDGVDEMYERLADSARERPHDNDTYDIYQFFAEDPDGRAVEFQTFLHPTDPV
ncbi:VOC family protein [Halorussus salilacus]|uniref:VOC family protein n=1 Tax=Halorussus salilacus TaxID=2953750 RepID=UPI0020A09998|nr:VOC family protein [Halorussus salilacus]USZ67544.1 VOC family protein [Halorussus salilacus]